MLLDVMQLGESHSLRLSCMLHTHDEAVRGKVMSLYIRNSYLLSIGRGALYEGIPWRGLETISFTVLELCILVTVNENLVGMTKSLLKK